MPAWVIWLLVAALFAAGELFTVAFLLGPIAVAAVAAALVAGLGGSVAVQLIVFIAGSLASLLVVRPIARRHVRMPVAIRTGTAALVGARATVVERVDDSHGRVSINGDVWTARPFFEGNVMEPGARVEVAKIEGATALVYE
jgi:membrane protein implicated in regulation of membrane protease activity